MGVASLPRLNRVESEDFAIMTFLGGYASDLRRQAQATYSQLVQQFASLTNFFTLYIEFNLKFKLRSRAVKASKLVRAPKAKLEFFSQFVFAYLPLLSRVESSP